MAKTRAPYAAAFRQQMIGLVHAGRTPEDLANEFEPTAQTIYNWVAQADRDAGKRLDGLSTAERRELTSLRRELRQVKMERDILATDFATRRGPGGRNTRRLHCRSTRTRGRQLFGDIPPRRQTWSRGSAAPILVALR
ncbi:transposase [Cupriavidus pinatubonensis]|uniref:transposase n=1 Tax=Cupriavidus pinatubonensis TaxID=248026 RepID=UPI001CC4A6E7